MTKSTQPIPEGYPTVCPFVITKSSAKLIDFATASLGATERTRVYNEDGESIGHAEIQIGDSVIMMFDSQPNWPATPAFLNIYVEDCDAAHRRALENGAEEVTPLSTNAWGDRGSRIRDPLGNIWWIQTHVEDVSEEEMMQRLGEEKYTKDMAVSTKTLKEAMESIR